MCTGLLRIAHDKQLSVLRADNLALPFRAGCMDACLCAAVIHHFSTAERRLRALQQLHRLLRVGGRALVSGWALHQQHSHYETMRKNRAQEEEEEAADGDQEHLMDKGEEQLAGSQTT